MTPSEQAVDRILEAVREELESHAHVFEDPRAYRAGVHDACEAAAERLGELPGGQQQMQALRHEMATPLLVIGSVTETLLRHGEEIDPETIRSFLEMARRNASLLTVLVDHLPMGRELEGTFAVDPEPVDLAGFLKQTVSDLRVVTRDRKVELLMDRSDAVVVADPDALRRILYALVSNGHRYSPAGWPITIRLSVRDGDATVRIVDGGPGVPVGQREAVFERYHRLHRDSSGLGLGLYLARGLARAHGGDLDLHAAPGGPGAMFLLRLPLAGVRDDQTADPTLSAPRKRRARTSPPPAGAGVGRVGRPG